MRGRTELKIHPVVGGSLTEHDDASLIGMFAGRNVRERQNGQRANEPQGYPAPHPDPKVDAFRPYIEAAVTELKAGFVVSWSWLDPYDPIDATIRIGELALVWDEWNGWRAGVFVSGRQGARTVLRDAVPLGGGVMPPAAELPQRVREAIGVMRERSDEEVLVAVGR